MTKPKKPDSLDAALKKSLQPPAPPAPDASPATPPPAPEPPPPPTSPRLTATISLHAEEQEKITQILAILLKLRRTGGGGVSDAVKIALQLCPLDPDKIDAAWKRARSQDGRSQRHR